MPCHERPNSAVIVWSFGAGLPRGRPEHRFLFSCGSASARHPDTAGSTHIGASARSALACIRNACGSDCRRNTGGQLAVAGWRAATWLATTFVRRAPGCARLWRPNLQSHACGRPAHVVAARASHIHRQQDGRISKDLLARSRRADLFGDYHDLFREFKFNCALVNTTSLMHDRLLTDSSMRIAHTDPEYTVFVSRRTESAVVESLVERQ